MIRNTPADDGIGVIVSVAAAALLDFLGHEITQTSSYEEDGFRFGPVRSSITSHKDRATVAAGPIRADLGQRYAIASGG